eukprot:GEMP01092965.1.p1 GENE.GEMP01092965.1~~GEMP01092965.1.p1  ORF type:complete len:148 (+),score=21.49 GEMP01092965.1:39-446(+)
MMRRIDPARFIAGHRSFNAFGVTSRGFAYQTITSKQEVEKFLSDKDRLAVLWFTASWCGPCRKIAPLCEEIGQRDDVNLLKIDVDEASELAGDYEISSVPTFRFLKNKKEIAAAFSGANEEMLKKNISEVLGIEL